MRSPGNFSPEWGYLAPAPSFMRTARIVLVATAIGATAGAAVVLSLIDRPAETPKIAAVTSRAVVTSLPAATSVPAAPAVAAGPVVAKPIASSVAVAPPSGAASPAKPAPGTADATPAPPSGTTGGAAPAGPAAHTANAAAPADAATAQAQQTSEAGVAAGRPGAGMAALSEPVTTPASATVTNDLTAAPEPTPPKKKRHVAESKSAPSPSLGTVLKRLFTPPAATYPKR